MKVVLRCCCCIAVSVTKMTAAMEDVAPQLAESKNCYVEARSTSGVGGTNIMHNIKLCMVKSANKHAITERISTRLSAQPMQLVLIVASWRAGAKPK